MSRGLSHFSLAQPHWVWGPILSGWLLGGRHWGEPSVQSNCGLKRLHDCKLRTLRDRPIPYPLLSEVILEFSLLTLEEASDPHLRF